MKKVYISGPMTGIEDFNKPAFMRAERRLREQDYHCVNPARIGVAIEADRKLRDAPPPEWRDYMQACLFEIPDCQEIYLLKGWENSKGAYIEFVNAKLFGLKVRFEV